MMATRRRRRRRTDAAPRRAPGTTPAWVYLGLALVALGVVVLVATALITR